MSPVEGVNVWLGSMWTDGQRWVQTYVVNYSRYREGTGCNSASSLGRPGGCRHGHGEIGGSVPGGILMTVEKDSLMLKSRGTETSL